VIDAAVIISFFERQRTGTGLAELLRDVARLGATELGTHAFFELRDTTGPVLMTSWPGTAEVGLVGPVGAHPLPAVHPLLQRYQATCGARWGFELSALTGCFVVLSRAPNPPLESTRVLGEVTAALVAAWDAERRSRDLAERHRLMSQATQHVIYDWDIATDTMSWNPRMADVFAHVEIGRDDIGWWREHLHPDDADRVWSALQHVMAENELYWACEYRFRRGDGGYAWVFDRGTLVYDSSRRAMRMLGVMEDISRDRELESRLALASRLAAVGSLASGIAHEINNPLAWVTSNLSFALEELKKLAGQGDDERVDEVSEALDDAQTGAARIAQIVNDLRTFAHADHERLAPVSVKRVVEGALTMANNELKHRARVIRRLDSAPMVMANEARLGQAVVNLLLNAAWSAGGHGRIPEVTVATATGVDGSAQIEITDNGQVIAADVLPHLFDPFFSVRVGGEGIGLGLAVTHSIVAGFGGAIDVESTPARGTTFRIVLPMVSDDAKSPPPPSPTTVVVQRARVMVIDDERSILTAIERALSSVHEVLGFTDARTAINAISERHPDVILCDLMMPDMNGADVWKHMEQVWPHLLPRVVLLTGGAFTREARDFLERCPAPVIDKPFTPKVLREAVDRVVASGLVTTSA
jgi:signal transduction histidine kinase/CheY-like chemotaxis protein